MGSGMTEADLGAGPEHHSGYLRPGQQRRQGGYKEAHPASGMGQEYLIPHICKEKKLRFSKEYL